MRVAIVPFTVDQSGKKTFSPVANVALVEEGYEPPDGMVAVPSDTAGIGDLYDGTAFALAPVADLSKAELAAFIDMLCGRVDVRAENLRLTLITPGSGQAMEYQESYAQAKVALAQDADHTADPTKPAVSAADYPMLAATIGYDIDPDTGKPATDVLGVARAVKRAYEGYLAAGAAIKAARTEGKAMVRAASTRADADAAFAAIQWPALG